LVVDTNDTLTGVVVPDEVWYRLETNLQIVGEKFEEILTQYSVDPEELGRPEDERYHHEWLNLDRVKFSWCEKGQHVIGRLPCRYHA